MDGKRRRKQAARRGRRAKRLLSRALILAAVLVAGAFGLRAYLSGKAAEMQTAAMARALVRRGPMRETVYGTGTTSAHSQPSVTAGASGTLAELRAGVGDAVSAGDVLAVLENDALDGEIADLEFALWELDDSLSAPDAAGIPRVIDAPVAGRVMAVYAKEGDDVLAVFRREGALALLSTDGHMRVELADVPADSGAEIGERVTVEGDGFSAQGVVTDVTRQGARASVTVEGDEYPMGAAVTVRAEDGAALGEGALEINKPLGVSFYGGTIQSVAVSPGDSVRAGDTLFRLEDAPPTLQIESQRVEREDAAAELAEARAERESLIVRAPCDGVVAEVSARVGDEVNKGATLLSILEGEEMDLTIAVDELDVVHVQPGQSVAVTVDALGDATLAGTVSKVSPVGSGSGGVTTYDVVLALDAAGSGVRSGMNATGEITVASKEDALYVPVEALMTVGGQTCVMLEGGASSPAMSGAPEMPDASGASGAATPSEARAMRGAGRGARRSSSDGADAPEASAGDEGAGVLARLSAAAKSACDAALDWLYGGQRPGSGETISGTLVPVTVGMQNDEYVELLSGVSEGDVLLCENAAQDDGFSGAFGGMSGMGGISLGGMGGAGFTVRGGTPGSSGASGARR